MEWRSYFKEAYSQQVARKVEVEVSSSGFYPYSGDYRLIPYHQWGKIHQIEHLRLDDIPIWPYPAGALSKVENASVHYLSPGTGGKNCRTAYCRNF